MSNLSSAERPLLCAVLALAWLYLSADLAVMSQGLDGTLYAGIAKLMAAGQGSFWAPPHFESQLTAFHDHPPLGLWLQSQWFALLGDAFWVEKTYSLCLGILICWLLARLWRVLSQQSNAWWPLLIFLLMPVTTYAIKNNTLETLLTVFSLAAVLAAWYAHQHIWLNILVGVLCFAAVMVKGPVALFILGVPGCFAVLLQNNWQRALVASAIATIVLAGLFVVTLSMDGAQQSWQQYYQSQLLASISGQRLIEHGRGYQAAQLAYNLLVAAVLVGLAAWFSRVAKPSREFWAMLIIGCSAALPLLISPRQYQHYLLPSMPLFALAAALLVKVPAPRRSGTWLRRAPIWLRRSSAWPWWVTASVLLLAVSRTVFHFGDLGDHEEDLADAFAVGKYVGQANPPVTSVGFCENDLRRRVYLFRHFGVRSTITPQAASSLTASPQKDTAVLVCPDKRVGADYQQVAVLNDGWVLWRRSI